MTTVKAGDAVAPQLVRSTQEEAQDGRVEAVGGNVGEVWRAAWWWGPGNGTWNLPIDWSVINPNSTVIITASEVDGNGVRFVGSAAFDVSSIAPRNGQVIFKINIGWGSAIPMRTDVLVIN
ncbi:hypothetical protein ABZ953_28195 [Streptomyces sp. NPDC046465]|uniref:hypothetical protein n=1 Tax=Streptomyces sp. NPDC046465 TaxID=3155810 RepID=UPI0034035E1F